MKVSVKANKNSLLKGKLDFHPHESVHGKHLLSLKELGFSSEKSKTHNIIFGFLLKAFSFLWLRGHQRKGKMAGKGRKKSKTSCSRKITFLTSFVLNPGQFFK